MNASYQSPYGAIKSSWKKGKGQLGWDITVPGNTTAIVYMPARQVAEVKEGGKQASSSEGIKFLKMENGNAVFEIGSGSYSFSISDYKLSTR